MLRSLNCFDYRGEQRREVLGDDLPRDRARKRNGAARFRIFDHGTHQTAYSGENGVRVPLTLVPFAAFVLLPREKHVPLILTRLTPKEFPVIVLEDR